MFFRLLFHRRRRRNISRDFISGASESLASKNEEECFSVSLVLGQFVCVFVKGARFLFEKKQRDIFLE